MAVTQQIGIGGMSAELQLNTFDKRLLSRVRAETVFNRFGMQRGIPMHGGKAISFRRLEAIYSAGTAGSAAAGSAPTALTEGTPPSAIDATWTQIGKALRWFVAFLMGLPAQECAVNNAL
jgi:hypothetical protein